MLGESTFESLGLLMPLYGGSVWMSDYVGVAKCAVHGAVEPHCFHVNAIRVTCGKCGQKTFRKREFVKCVHCRATVPPLRSSQDPLACHAAIVAGDAAFQVSTHLGLVSAFKRPRKIAPEAYELLLRTSPLSSWQEVAWPFHCSAPMTYLGSRTSEQLAELPLNESERKTLDDDIYEADDQVIEDLMTFHCATCLHYQWVHDRD